MREDLPVRIAALSLGAFLSFGASGQTTDRIVVDGSTGVMPLAINGISPSADNVERNAYPLVRESFFVTKSSPSPGVARVLEFARSPAGAEVIRANGAIPVR